MQLKQVWLIEGHPKGDIVVLNSDADPVPIQIIRDSLQSRVESDALQTRVTQLEAEKQTAEEKLVAAERAIAELRRQLYEAELAGVRRVALPVADFNKRLGDMLYLNTVDKIVIAYGPQEPEPELGESNGTP